MFQRVLKFLRDPRVLISAGTILAVVVLAGGARIVFDRWLVAGIVALALVLIVLVLVLLWVLYGQDREKRVERGTEGEEEVASRQGRAKAKSALTAIEERFRRAVAEVRRSQRGPKGIYQNPWYLVLGETGSGKSALISASGLELPAKFASLVTRGPTENCDWWIMNEAVLLDTSGRYAEVLDDDVRKEWRRLLKLLRKTRSKCPVNGILLALPATTLLGQDDATLTEMAKELRRRLNEVSDRLGVDVPIYVVITKCDRIDGFLETVRALPPNRMGDALGWTNPERRIANFGEQVAAGLSGVVTRLDELLPELLMREPDSLRRAKLFLFPQALGEVARAAGVFLGQLFQRAISEETPFLRGVYFTSALQEGQTVSPLLDALHHGWAHAPASHEGRPASIFVRDLFREIIVDPEEAGLARRTSRLGPLGSRLLLVTGAAFTLGLAAWLSASFALNFRGIGRVKDETAAILAVTPSIRMISELRDRIEMEAVKADAFFHRAGLFGRMQFALDRARRSFVWSFEREYEEPTKSTLVSTVRQLDPSRSFAALADLALDISWLEATLRERQADLEEPLPTESATEPTAPRLARYAPITQNEVDQSQFQASYASFVRWLDDVDLRTRIQRERDELGRFSAELLTIEQLEAWAERNATPVRYADVMLPDRGSVHPAYTRETWEKLVSGLIEGIERTGGVSQQAVDQFGRDYVERYDKAWRRYLVETPTPIQAHSNVKNSPYLALLDQIDANASAEIRREKPPAWLERFEEIRRATPDSAVPSESEKPQDPPWLRYQAALEKVADDVNSVEVLPEEALGLAQTVIEASQPNSFSEAIEVIRAIVPIRGDRRAAARLREILAMPVLDGYSAVLDAAMSELDRRWYDEIASDPRFGRGASASDLNALYGRGGALEKFRKENLDPFLEADDIDPLLRDRTPPLGPEFKEWLEAAREMGRTISGAGGGPSRVRVGLEGVPSRVVGDTDLYVTRRELRIDCTDKVHLFIYREGTGRYGLTWTPECQEVSLRVWVRRPGEAERQLSSRLEWTGPLAFNQFVRSGRSPSDPGSNLLSWELDDFEGRARIIVKYRLRGGEDIISRVHTEPPRSMWN